MDGLVVFYSMWAGPIRGCHGLSTKCTRTHTMFQQNQKPNMLCKCSTEHSGVFWPYSWTGFVPTMFCRIGPWHYLAKGTRLGSTYGRFLFCWYRQNKLGNEISRAPYAEEAVLLWGDAVLGHFVKITQCSLLACEFITLVPTTICTCRPSAMKPKPKIIK
jgi:hypothetical protein